MCIQCNTEFFKLSHAIFLLEIKGWYIVSRYTASIQITCFDRISTMVGLHDLETAASGHVQDRNTGSLCT